jgi:N-acetylglucosaminyldiphosphoundecaprenol N-acetyl-beta-D-mannosaminyltransferase
MFDCHLDLVNTSNRGVLMAEVEARFANTDGFALATLNLDHLVKLNHSSAFRAAYAAQDLVVADGNPVVWLLRLAGQPVELVPGSELVAPLSELAARMEVPVALLGSTPDALEAAAARLEQDHPGLKVAARISPPFGFDPEGPAADACLEDLKASGARLCFLALGAPKQEIFAARGRTKLPSCGFASVGAGIDFIAGTQERAPRWVRAIAMEWLWRALSNPRRLAWRYAQCFMILPGLTWQAWKQRRVTDNP